eukprot:1215448-Prymnesium_polylepis.1
MGAAAAGVRGRVQGQRGWGRRSGGGAGVHRARQLRAHAAGAVLSGDARRAGRGRQAKAAA